MEQIMIQTRSIVYACDCVYILSNNGIVYKGPNEPSSKRDTCDFSSMGYNVVNISGCGHLFALVTDSGKIILKTSIMPLSSAFYFGYNETHLNSIFVTGMKKKFIAVECGGSMIISLDSSGTVWTFNSKKNEFREVPRACFMEENVTLIRAGSQHCAAVTSNNVIFSWGLNKHGELGLGYPIQASLEQTPVKIQHEALHAEKVEDISLGWHFTAIRTRKNIWVCGVGTFGQLGLGDRINRYTPTAVRGMQNTRDVSCGLCWTLVVDSRGIVWSTGRRSCVLGNKKQLDQILYFTKIENLPKCDEVYSGNNIALARSENGDVFDWGLYSRRDFSSYFTPTQINLYQDVVVGRWKSRKLDPQKTIAFLMALHPRLGHVSSIRDLEIDVIYEIIQISGNNPRCAKT